MDELGPYIRCSEAAFVEGLIGKGSGKAIDATVACISHVVAEADAGVPHRPIFCLALSITQSQSQGKEQEKAPTPEHKSCCQSALQTPIALSPNHALGFTDLKAVGATPDQTWRWCARPREMIPDTVRRSEVG